jgi:outer membrane protein assembly factor BamB
LFYVKGPAVYDHLIAADEVLLLAYTVGSPYSTTTCLDAYSMEGGRHLWRYKGSSPERAGAAAYVIDDIVWIHRDDRWKPLTALDVTTGKARKDVDCSKVFDVGHHHRCYGNRATSRFLMTGRRGVEFIGFDTGETYLNHWIRGKCRFGVLPCNGLLYTIPHACSCYPFSTLKGYSALAERSGEEAIPEFSGERLTEGPAYGKKISPDANHNNSHGWRTHRHDVMRSGSTPSSLPDTEFETGWSISVGGTPSSLTAADERVFVAVPDDHRLYALAAGDGAVLWSFTAGGRVDSPPTIYEELALFGCADGSVYCLRADTGELVWQFLAAHTDRRIVADEQLESVWPIHGAVLVQNDIAYVSAGRTSLLDGGIALFGLEPETGAILSRRVIHNSYAEAEPAMLRNDGRNFNGDIGVLQDVLVGDGENVYLHQIKLNAECVPTGKSDRIISGNGLLNPAWFSRIGWYFGTPTKETRHSNADPDKYDIFDSPRQGQYLVFNEDTTYSVRLYPNIGKFARYFEPGEEGYRIFADDNSTSENRWNRYVPIRVESMVAAGGETLLLAGTPDIVDPEDPWAAIEGKKGGLLWALETEKGEKLTEMKLDSSPVFDGVIVHDGKIFMGLRNGEIVCCE